MRAGAGDGDTCPRLNCVDGQIPVMTNGVWGCGDDAQGNAQGDGDTLADLQCAEGQVPVRNAEGAWACGDANWCSDGICCWAEFADGRSR